MIIFKRLPYINILELQYHNSQQCSVVTINVETRTVKHEQTYVSAEQPCRHLLLFNNGVVVGHVGGGVLEVDSIRQVPLFSGLLPSPVIHTVVRTIGYFNLKYMAVNLKWQQCLLFSRCLPW